MTTTKHEACNNDCAKIAKQLRLCSNNTTDSHEACSACPWHTDRPDCICRLMNDAARELERLREQLAAEAALETRAGSD